MVKNKDMQFLMDNFEMKRKKEKKFDLPERRFEPQIFLPMIWIFMWNGSQRSNQNKLLKEIGL